MISDEQIEQEVLNKGLNGPRVKLADIEAAISAEHYFTAQEGVDGSYSHGAPQVEPLSMLTFCVLVLKNGYTVTGESACVSDENFDEELGRKIARQHAIDKCWALFGFHLAATERGLID